ncbi:MAG: hypothetical protein BWK78_06090 [Thiotrichaceae bacterium IS1]|nr:MAG: hypothetical protein BWK78_06090 [Thiotrichaceae bacterium IS1]
MTDANGLYYMRARFYSAEMKRFVNQDVLVGKVGEGQSLNRYAFVTGNPVSWVDPFGQYAIVAVQPSGAYGFGHAAIAIQNPNTGKLEYFNFAPDTTLEGNIISKIFNYGNVGRVKHSEMDEEEFFRVNKRSGYEDFLIIETTPEQEQNMIEFAKTLKQRFAEQQEYYRTHTNNCADFVTRVLDSQLPPAILGSYIPNTLIDDLKQSYDGEIMIKDMPWWPIFMDKQVNSWKIDDLIRVIDLWFDDE